MAFINGYRTNDCMFVACRNLLQWCLKRVTILAGVSKLNSLPLALLQQVYTALRHSCMQITMLSSSSAIIMTIKTAWSNTLYAKKVNFTLDGEKVNLGEIKCLSDPRPKIVS